MYSIPDVDLKKQKKREKIGLVAFVLGILAIFAAVGAYMFFGHNFDLAASGIDSHVGQLNGYATITFEGTNEKRVLKNNISRDKEVSLDNSIKATCSNVNQYYKQKGATVCTIKCSDYTAYEEGEIFERGGWKIGVLSINESVLNDTLQSKKDQIIKERTENGVFKDQSKIMSEVKEETGKSFTSLSIKKKTPQMINLQQKINNLYKDNKADLVIVLAPHQDIYDVIDTVDCVIARTVYDDIPDNGKQVNSTFIMPVPEDGKIGAILSSPAKSLSETNFAYLEEK